MKDGSGRIHREGTVPFAGFRFLNEGAIGEQASEHCGFLWCVMATNQDDLGLRSVLAYLAGRHLAVLSLIDFPVAVAQEANARCGEQTRRLQQEWWLMSARRFGARLGRWARPHPSQHKIPARLNLRNQGHSLLYPRPRLLQAT